MPPESLLFFQLIMIPGIHRWQVESACLSQFRLQGQKAYPGGPSKIRRDYDILCVVDLLYLSRIIELTGVTDSSLESIYRKQEKGWTRGNGTVKEDSKCRNNLAHTIFADFGRRCHSFH